MRKHTKIWLVVAAVLVLGGSILCVTAAASGSWDFGDFSTGSYETNTHPVNDTFRSISIQTDTADIDFLPAQDGLCAVVCREPEKARHTVFVDGGTLTVREEDQREWYDYIGIFSGSAKITVYLPEEAYETLTVRDHTGDVRIPKDFRFQSMDITVTTGDVENYASAAETVKIHTSTGSIAVDGVSAGRLDLSVSTGKTEVTDTACETLISDGGTGRITLKNVIATDSISITRGTGDVRFVACDAEEITVRTGTGDVTGTFLTGKNFDVHTNTGRARYPKDSTGGKCQVSTSTGDIELSIQ